MAQLCFDLTARFVELYIDPYSRTKDQMTQAARSGVQNIAEGSQASGTSKKTELKLTNVARASLEELKLDYEDYLLQKELSLLSADDPVLLRFKKLRCQSIQQFRDWVAQGKRLAVDGHGLSLTGTDKGTRKGKISSASVGRCSSVKVGVLSSTLWPPMAFSPWFVWPAICWIASSPPRLSPLKPKAVLPNDCIKYAAPAERTTKKGIDILLDTETKKRIDDCRDILVGKIPDPKGQVEQITIALIYKFMDDMDNQSIEMGGEPGFFVGDYARFVWSRILTPA